MTPEDDRALMMAVISIGAKVIALEANPRIWKTKDQLALCRDLYRLQQRLAIKEKAATRNE